MSLLQPFSRKELSNSRHGLCSTLSPLAPPFTVKRNRVNPNPNPPQVIEPTFNDYFSSIPDDTRDTWLHLHPPSASDSLVSVQTPAVSSVPDFPPSAFSRESGDSTYPPGSYRYVGASTDIGFSKKKAVVSDDPCHVVPLPNVSRVSDCSIYPSESYGYPGVRGKADMGGKKAVSVDPHGVPRSNGPSSMLKYLQYPSECGYYCVGVVPDGSSASEIFNERLCAYENIWGSFQGNELQQEKKANDVEQSEYFPEINKLLPDLDLDLQISQQPELSLLPPGTFAIGDAPLASRKKFGESFGRHTQTSNLPDNQHLFHDLSAEALDVSAQSPLSGTSGTTSPSPCATPPSNVLHATPSWPFMDLDPAIPNGHFVQRSSCPWDSTVVHAETPCYPFVQAFQPLPSENPPSNGPTLPDNVNYRRLFPVDPFRHMKNLDAVISSDERLSWTNIPMESDPPYDFIGCHEASNNGNNIYLQPMTDRFSSCQESVNYRSDGRSLENPETRQPNSLSNPLVSEQVVDDFALSVHNLSEKNDHLISAVDSPCWKGVPASRHSPFEVAKTTISLPHCLKTHEMCDDSVHLRGGIVPPSKMLNQSFCNNNHCVDASFPPGVDTATVLYTNGDEIISGECPSSGDISRGTHRMMEPCLASSSGQERELKILSASSITKEEPGSTSSGKATISETTEVDPSIHTKRSIEDGLSDFLSQSIDHTHSSGCTGTSNSTDIQENHNGLSDNSSEDVPDSTDAHIVLKSMHNLSALLLSSLYTGENVLQEDSRKILQLVINNLKQLTLKAEELKSEPWSPLKNPYSRMTESDPSKVNDVLLRNNHNDGGEDHSRIQVYKTLWLEAESALCAMKYEARLARMEVEILQAKLHQGESSGFKDSSQAVSRKKMYDGVDDNVQKLHEPESLVGNHTDLESSIIGRFKILGELIEKSRKVEKPPMMADAINVVDYAKPQTLKAENEKNHKARRDAPNLIDATESRYINNLKKDYDRVDITNQNVHEHEALLSDYDYIEPSVAARLEILKQRYQNSDHPGGSTSSPDSVDINTADCNQKKEEVSRLLPSQTEVLKADPDSNFPLPGLQKWMKLIDKETRGVQLQPKDHNVRGRYHTQISGAYVPPSRNFHGMHPIACANLDAQGSFWPHGSDLSGAGTCLSSRDGAARFKNEPVGRLDGYDGGGAAIVGSNSSQSDCTYGWEHVLKEEVAS